MARKVHPVADLFPLLPDAELRALAEDIKANGQLEPIVFWKGMLVDGRNRMRACELYNLEPVTTDRFFPDDAAVVSYILSQNLHRRHLDASQRAMIGAELEKHFSEEARKRMLAGKSEPSDKIIGGLKGEARELAATAVNVSPAMIQHAKRVKAEGTAELVAAVVTGDMPVSVAAEVAHLPQKEQREVVAAGPKVAREKAKEVKQERLASKKQTPKQEPTPEPVEHPDLPESYSLQGFWGSIHFRREGAAGVVAQLEEFLAQVKREVGL